MNSLQQLIKKEIVEPELNKRLLTIKAVVTRFDYRNNVADVEFTNPTGAGRNYIENVPVQIAAPGLHSAGPFEGDEVWLTFLYGRESMPRVTGVVDEYEYAENIREGRLKHTRQGAMLPDSLTRM